MTLVCHREGGCGVRRRLWSRVNVSGLLGGGGLNLSATFVPVLAVDRVTGLPEYLLAGRIFSEAHSHEDTVLANRGCQGQ
jgi:hypothetical protein